ncbi:MAG: phospholipase [Bacteroidia bacterium]|nr:phospholipase [Bacteroidia bacterium]
MEKIPLEEINLVNLKTTRTGRVAQLGDLSKDTKELWLVFHGYRMLATNFLRKFHVLSKDDNCILAPEGLSRFYVDGVSGRVGASWMTKEERLSEIADQEAWLDRIWEWIQANIDPQNCKIHMLAFSQGVATLWRWLDKKNIVPETITLYAGKIPDETSPEFEERLPKSKKFFLYGNEDQFINEQTAAYLKQLMLARMPDLEIIQFEGKHDVYPDPLRKLKSLIEENA